MKRMTLIFVALTAFAALMVTAQNTVDRNKNWPEWRGPLMSGVAPNSDPAFEWSETKNIKWKIAIPGKGHSTPIIWGDMMFLQAAVPTEQAVEIEKKPAVKPEQGMTNPHAAPPGQKMSGSAAQAHGSMQSQVQERGQGQPQRRGMTMNKSDQVHRFVVVALNRITGKILWQKTVREERPEEGTHEVGSWASNSPVTDGEFLYAYFGSRGLFCLDFSGNIKWERDFGQMKKKMEFGEGSSPTLSKDKIMVLWDHEGESFLYILDKKTGKDIHKIARDEATTWGSPFVIEADGKHQVVTSATKLIRSYDPDTGELIWQCAGLTANVIPQPVYQDGILYIMSGFRGNAMLAIRVAGAKGDITDSDAIVWKYDGKETPYTPSPALFNNRLYVIRSNNGYLSCFNAKTGEEIYSGQKLEGTGSIFTSPLVAGGRIYIVGQQGTSFVIQEGTEFKILAKNVLEDNFVSSPVAVGRTLYLRGYRHLYCIEE